MLFIMRHLLSELKCDSVRISVATDKEDNEAILDIFVGESVYTFEFSDDELDNQNLFIDQIKNMMNNLLSTSGQTHAEAPGDA